MVNNTILACNKWSNQQILDIHQQMLQLTLGIICKSVLNYEIEAESHKVSKLMTTFHSSHTNILDIFLLELLHSCKQLLHRVGRSGSKKSDKESATTGNFSIRTQNSIARVLGKLAPVDKLADSRDAKMQLDSIVYRLIVDRRKDEKRLHHSYDKDLLSKLIQAQDAGKMSDLQVRDELMTIFVAGHETTANSLAWTFYLLSQNTNVQEKLHKEIDAVLDNGNAIPSIEYIPRLEYTESIFREALRLFPPIWSIRRYVRTDFTLSGYIIPAGSTILMSPYVMHHDPHYYEEPERFNPDRWTDEFKKRLPRFSYFPFGGGKRSCIGESFSWMEAVLVIAVIAQKWEMQSVPNQNVKLDPGSTLRPKYGIRMRINLRKRN